MKSIDLRQQQINLDELLRTVGEESVRITSKEGEVFVLEVADAFEREAVELGQSARFVEFLAERSAESGRISLEEMESRLNGAEPTTSETGATVRTDRDTAGRA